MQSQFNEQLNLLNHEIIEMGTLCEAVSPLASSALTTGGAAE